MDQKKQFQPKGIIASLNLMTCKQPPSWRGACTLGTREKPLKSVENVSTEVYPGFATDLQAPFMVMQAVAEGTCVLTENIFENRYRHVPEMRRFPPDLLRNQLKTGTPSATFCKKKTAPPRKKGERNNE